MPSVLPSRRVVITGIGMVTPLGHTVDTTWQALMAQHSGINTIEKFDASSYPTRIAAEVKNFKLNDVGIKPKLKKYTVPFTEYALASAEQALQDAGIRPCEQDAARWGVVVGAGMMSADFSYWQSFQNQFAPEGEVNFESLKNDPGHFFSINDFARTQANSGVALLAHNYNIQGYTNSVHTACASGGQALGLGLQAIRRGDSDVVLAGGFDSMINPVGLASFCLLGALASDNDNPKYGSRPFNKNRAGFVLGEGAAFLILEEWEHAKTRGATVYAEFAGEGNSLSSYRITDSHPSGDGAIQSIQGALHSANVDAEQIDYINAHGTSTKMNDLSECAAIHSVLGKHAKTPYVSSTKSLTGHLIAAAGSLEAAICALTLRHQTVPVSANLDEADPDCDLNFVKNKPIQAPIKTVLSNSFGFGGSNSSLVFKQFEGY